MELTLNFGELGQFTFKSVEELEYVATYLGWQKYNTKIVQVQSEPQNVYDSEGNIIYQEDGITPVMEVSVYPQTVTEENEINARTYLIMTAKKMLMEIPTKAFLKMIEQEAEILKKQKLNAIRAQIEQQTQ